MKRIVLFSLLLSLVFGSVSCNAQAAKKDASTPVVSEKIEVYYFHFSRRCVTCNAVETETVKHLQALYPEQMKNGSISFTSVNLEEEKSKAIAEKCKVTGQSLLIVSGSSRTDLTQSGFMNARSQPEKLKKDIKSAIDPLLKK